MPNYRTDTPGPVAWMIIDRDELIRGHSHALRRLIGSPDGALVGRSFGEVSGCTNALFEHSGCGQTSRCSACALHRAVVHTQHKREDCGPSVLIRDFIIEGQVVERAWAFRTHTLCGAEPGMVLVTFEQLAHEWVRRLHPRQVLHVTAAPPRSQPRLCSAAAG